MTRKAAEMILDTSALIAILRFEAEAPEFAKIVERAAQPRISVVSYVESCSGDLMAAGIQLPAAVLVN